MSDEVKVQEPKAKVDIKAVAVKASPIVVGVVIAIVGVLVGLGVLKPTVKDATLVPEGTKVEFTAGTMAMMAKVDLQITVKSNTVSGECWVLYGMNPPPAPEQPAVPVEPAKSVTPVGNK